MCELEAQFVSVRANALDFVLSNRARLIFHLNLQVLRGHDLGGKIQDIRQLLGGEPMIRIILRHPSLQKAGLKPPNGAATINKVLRHVPDLGDVEIGRNRVSIRQDESDVLGRMLTEVCLEGPKVHAILGIFSYRYMQAEIEFRALAPPDYDQVVALWRNCDGVEVAQGDDAESFTRYLDRNPGLSYAATCAGAIVGACICGHDGRRGLVYHLAVAPEYRGQGVAKEILRMGLAGLRRCGIARVIILVSKDNAIGQEFWISQGFEHISGALPLGMDLT